MKFAIRCSPGLEIPRGAWPAPNCAKDPSPLKVKDVLSRPRTSATGGSWSATRRTGGEGPQGFGKRSWRAWKTSFAAGQVAGGEQGYRKYVKVEEKDAFAIDRAKIRGGSPLSTGKWVLRSNWNQASAEELALRYKDLWQVEAIFRAAKTVLQTRPIYHKRDETIRGHVFCSFLALVLMKEWKTGSGQGIGPGVGGRVARPGSIAGDAAGQRRGDVRVAKHAAGGGGESCWLRPGWHWVRR